MKEPPRRPTLPMGLAPVGERAMPKPHPASNRKTPRVDRYVKLGDAVPVDKPLLSARLGKAEVSALWEELQPQLAWLAEDRRPELLSKLERSELSSVLAELRAEQERFPKNLSITRALRSLERTAIRLLLRSLEPLDRIPTVTRDLGSGRLRPHQLAVFRLVDGTRTLNAVMRASTLSRLETLTALEELGIASWIRLPQEPAFEEPEIGLPAALETFNRETPRAAEVSTRPPPPPALEPRSDQPETDWGLEEGDRPTYSDPEAIEAQVRKMRKESATTRPPERADLNGELPAVLSLQPTQSDASLFGAPSRSERVLRDSFPPVIPLASAAPPPEAPISNASDEPVAISEPPPEPETPSAVAPSQASAPAPKPAAESSVSREASAPEASPEAPPIRRAFWAVSGLAAISTVAALYFALRSPERPAVVMPVVPTPAATTSPAPSAVPLPATTTPPIPATESSTVRLRIDVSPDYARVYLDGRRVKPPYDYSVSRDATTRVVRVEAPGHRASKLTFVPREDLRLVVGLEPLPKAEPVVSAAPVKEPEPSFPY